MRHRRTALKVAALASSESRRVHLKQLMDDLTFLMGRPEEESWVLDMMESVHYRRDWVLEREAYERERQRKHA